MINAIETAILSFTRSVLSIFNSGKGSIIFRAILILCLAFAFLIIGSGVVVYASGASLPGDMLYPLKTSFEDLQARLIVNPASQSRLYLNFAGRRLVEM